MKRKALIGQEELLREFVRGFVGGRDSLLSESMIIEDFERNVDTLISEGIVDVVRSAYHGAKGALSRGAVNALRRVNDTFIDLVQKALAAARRSAVSGIKFYRAIVDKISVFKDAHPVMFKVVMTMLAIVLVYAALSLFDTATAHASLSSGGKPVDEKTYLEVRGMLLQHMDKVGTSDIDKKLELGKVVVELDTAFKSKDEFQVEKFGGYAGKVITKGFEIVSRLIKETQSSDSKVSTTAVELLKQWYQLAKSTTISAI